MKSLEINGESHRTAVIDGREWMTENVKCKVGAYRMLREFPSLVIYSWEMALDLCPKGWRIPTYDDVNRLVIALSGQRINWKIDLDTLKAKDEFNGIADKFVNLSPLKDYKEMHDQYMFCWWGTPDVLKSQPSYWRIYDSGEVVWCNDVKENDYFPIRYVRA